MKSLLPYDKKEIPVEIGEQNFVAHSSQEWNPTGRIDPSRT
jgi:hypothetical protein